MKYLLTLLTLFFYYLHLVAAQNRRPRIFGKIVQYHFTVYNRWGQKVFDSYDNSKGWDGSINGRPVDEGTYVCSCSYQLNNEPGQHKKGTVVLVR